ncbi:MarC family protein [Thermodesulfatator atlanticus]|uniref:MarC family protein n=1 Tax=Thermodesulfatator atlanticus TaxID=501497 RepID=UPI0003B31A75|nr:MarC family protein [Thermodesulfatator atlanticus]
MIGFILQIFGAFLAIMNPVGNIPIFVGLVEEFEEKTRVKVAKKSVIWAFIICSVFIFAGNFIFRFYGITLPAFRIAGGILIFLIAYQLLRGKASRQHHPGEEEHEEADPDSIAITPLATPILAGPGTITTAMSFAAKRTNILELFIIEAVFGVVCLLTYICFVYGEAISEKLGRTKIGVITRLMGLILAVIAVQMVLEGIKEAFPYLASGTISKP